MTYIAQIQPACKQGLSFPVSHSNILLMKAQLFCMRMFVDVNFQKRLQGLWKSHPDLGEKFHLRTAEGRQDVMRQGVDASDIVKMRPFVPSCLGDPHILNYWNICRAIKLEWKQDLAPVRPKSQTCIGCQSTEAMTNHKQVKPTPASRKQAVYSTRHQSFGQTLLFAPSPVQRLNKHDFAYAAY